MLLLLSGRAAAQSPSKFRPYAGLHGSGDAAMFFLGPSVQFGVDYHCAEPLRLSAYTQYARSRIDRRVSPAEFEQGRLDGLTLALLAEVHLGRTPERGMFVGAGGAWQLVSVEVLNNLFYLLEDRAILVPALRVGHAFRLGTHQLTAELNATGPYHVSDEFGSHTELITQLSLGTRFVW